MKCFKTKKAIFWDSCRWNVENRTNLTNKNTNIVGLLEVKYGKYQKSRNIFMVFGIFHISPAKVEKYWFVCLFFHNSPTRIPTHCFCVKDGKYNKSRTIVSCSFVFSIFNFKKFHFCSFLFFGFGYFRHFTYKNPILCFTDIFHICLVASLVLDVLKIEHFVIVCILLLSISDFPQDSHFNFWNGRGVNSWVLYSTNFSAFCIHIHTHNLSMTAAQWVCTGSVASGWGHAEHATIMSLKGIVEPYER